MFSERPPVRRGRPPGATAQSLQTRRHLYATAVQLLLEGGLDACTLRAIAARAEVSVGLLYRYFPNKRAVLMTLYTDLATECAHEIVLPAGTWRGRTLYALQHTQRTLAPQRALLQALLPWLMDPTEKLMRPPWLRLYVNVVRGAQDAPKSADTLALATLLYLLHGATLLAWLRDASPQQRATRGLMDTLEQVLWGLTVALRMPMARRTLRAVAAFAEAGLWG